MFKARPSQQEIIEFEKGRMGVAAVPGSGKTHTLSYLAANLIAKGLIDDDQEVLIVTLVNSSVDNFSQRISKFIGGFGLMPNFGYRVRTLHGLAHDIVKERPGLVGLEDHFEIADEGETHEIIERISGNWLKTNPDFVEDFKNKTIENHSTGKVKMGWEQLLADIADGFIRQSKDLELNPVDIRTLLDKIPKPSPLLELGYHAYSEYQRALSYRGAVDFEDLIRLAIQALRADKEFLLRLAHRWPFILEDEAQDSSLLQEKILQLLADNGSSWVRVGDPNQAIYETFTTASPRYLREFMRQKGVAAHDLPNSGRSTKSIITLANHLITWTNSTHPVAEIKEALTPPLILPTPPGDPQPNPPDDPNGIHLYIQKLEPAEEIQLIAKSIQRWIKENSDKTIAVLVPRNERGAEMVNALQSAQIDCIELLQTSHSTRKAARSLGKIMQFFADPTKSTSLAEFFKVFIEYTAKENPKNELLLKLTKDILDCKNVENFLAPVPGKDDLRIIKDGYKDNWVLDILEDFHSQLHKWQRACLLPIDQFILTISMILFKNPAELATAYKIANFLERAGKLHPEWNFTDFTNQLTSIAANRIKLIGFSEEDLGFDPDQYKGKVVVSTVHKAKGLEWDRVYLLSVNNYDYPSYEEQDQYIAERWFIRDQLNLQAETLAALKSLVNISGTGQSSEEGMATQQARLDYCSERLRLLYVGITRARRELIVTWNTGQRGQCYPAIPLKELYAFWEENHGTSS